MTGAKTQAMAELSDLAELLGEPNHAVIATINKDGSVHSTMIWVNVEGENIAFNSARGRVWPANLERDPGHAHAAQRGRPVRVRRAHRLGGRDRRRDDADQHMDTLAQKYLNQDVYPWRKEGEERVKFHFAPAKIRHVKA